MQSEALGYFADSQKKPDIREAFSMGPVNGERSERLQRKYAAEEDDFYRRVIDFCYQPTPWPSSNGQDFDSRGFRDALEAFYRHASSLGTVLLEICALALDLPRDHFERPSVPGENCNSARTIWYVQTGQQLKLLPRLRVSLLRRFTCEQM